MGASWRFRTSAVATLDARSFSCVRARSLSAAATRRAIDRVLLTAHLYASIAVASESVIHAERPTAADAPRPPQFVVVVVDDARPAPQTKAVTSVAVGRADLTSPVAANSAPSSAASHVPHARHARVRESAVGDFDVHVAVLDGSSG